MPSPKRPFLISAGLAALVVGLSGAGAASGATTVPAADAAPAAKAAPSVSAAPSGGGAVRDVVLAVHGGAGSLPRGSLTPEQEKAYRDGLTKALRTGYDLVKDGRPVLDAVEKAVNVLEDDPLFNAGKGAVFNTDAEHELDASIMNGKDQRSGAVAGVHHTKNPISLARMVMEKSPHVFMAGKGADDFALRNGVPFTTQDYFWTQRRWDQLMAAKGNGTAARATGPEVGGTGGAIALSPRGELAAPHSTKGIINGYVTKDGSVVTRLYDDETPAR